MKLVIDINEDYLNDIKSISDETSTADMLLIKYATPLSEVLDSIKGEIASLNIKTINTGEFTRTMAELYSLKKLVLAIIDKYGKEQT